MGPRANRPLRDASLALSLLTALPTSTRWPEGEQTGAAAWFPVVGLILGSFGWVAVHALEFAGWDGRASLVVGALIVAMWAGATRMLHWDGLADYSDGLWGGSTPEERLAIMADVHTGAFGATAVVIVALVETGSVASILSGDHEMPILLIPAFARMSASCAAWLGRPARPSGLGRSVMGPPTPFDVVMAAGVVGSSVALLYWGFGVSGAVIGLVGIVLALGVPHVLAKPTGGVTGDVMGAGVLVCEALLFASAALLWGA